MKKILLFTFVILIVFSCKKVKYEPEGPTDVRIRNLTTYNMANLVVSTGGGEYLFGNLGSLGLTTYHRFDKAYPRANISAYIGNQRYKTDTITSYAYMQYMGLMKITYSIWVEGNKLVISNVVPDDTIKLK
jgi:hypothetical protein